MFFHGHNFKVKDSYNSRKLKVKFPILLVQMDCYITFNPLITFFSNDDQVMIQSDMILITENENKKYHNFVDGQCGLKSEPSLAFVSLNNYS